MSRFLLFACLIVLTTPSDAVIDSLNDTEYARMPALYGLDDYHACMLDPGALYCVANVDLHSSKPSPLLDMIKEYSANTIRHYNHTQIHRGVCLQRTCAKYAKRTGTNQTLDPSATLEACLNETLWKDYELEGRVAKVEYCVKEGETRGVDASDIVMAIVYILLAVCLTVGTVYDLRLSKEDDKNGNRILLAFSIRRNWIRMTANASGSDPRLERLKLFHGLRTLTMIGIIFSHTSLIMSYTYTDNPLYVERTYDDPFKQFLINGQLVTHTFFVMSAFLLAFNFQIHMEKRSSVSWMEFPKGVLMRWLRLTPVYAFIIGTICTWYRRLGAGPLWELVVVREADACRQWWWAQLLYLNNYIYADSQCLPQAWYLGADMQLFVLGLLVCVLCRTPRTQKIVLSTLMVIAIVIVTATTYFYDLGAVSLQSPETYRNLYDHDDTFRLLYIRGHTNMSTYILGLAGGFLAYYMMRDGKNLDAYKRYKWAYWLFSFPLGACIVLSGGFWYVNGEQPAMIWRLLYAALYKPIFQTLVVVMIFGTVFKYEDLYRRVMEWRGFTWMGRVTYATFLVHTLFQRTNFGASSELIRLSDYFIVVQVAASLFLSFTGAAVLYMFVEAPCTQLIKALMTPRRPRRHLEHNMAAAENGDANGNTKL